MKIFRSIKNGAVGGLKSAIFQKVIRREPVIIKDVENKLLDGKTAIVTGGNSGIGLAISRKFLASGAKVIILARNPEKTKSVADEIGCEYIISDVTDTERMVKALHQLIFLRSEFVGMLWIDGGKVA